MDKYEWTKFKAFADNKSNVAKVMISVVDGIEVLWEKEKMLAPFLTMFSKGFFLRVVKSRDCLGKS